ncbi:Flavodoxin-like_fold [Hexamita inflata]|uniref:Flavodoxin-like_fold n=1 Tax=Hexamita inflata TaxID=28002 RepID=A0ABP1H8V3_9EUKA
MFKPRETFQRIAFQYPVYWWAMPAVGKSYLETVVNTETDVLANKKIKIVQTLGSGKGGYGTRDMQNGSNSCWRKGNIWYARYAGDENHLGSYY